MVLPTNGWPRWPSRVTSGVCRTAPCRLRARTWNRPSLQGNAIWSVCWPVGVRGHW